MDLIPLRNDDQNSMRNDEQKVTNGKVVPYQHPNQHRHLTFSFYNTALHFSFGTLNYSLLFEDKRNLYQVNTVFKINAWNKIYLFYYKCMYMCKMPTCMYVYRIIALCPQKSEQGAMFPRTEVTGDCKVPCATENWTWVLERAANALNHWAFSSGLRQ